MAVQTRPHTFGIDRFLNARAATAPSFSPDGRSVAFLADITGLSQLWQVSIEGGWPEQLTFSENRVMVARYAHQVPEVAIGMDSGGNERQQIYLLRDGRLIDIAVNPDVMYALGDISPDDRQVAFSGNGRNPAYFDVYVSDIDGSNQRLVYQQDGSNFVTDWSPDGKKLLIMRRTGSLDAELLCFDMTTSQAIHLTPHQPPVIYEQAHFAPDGGSIYLITNQDSEFNRAARLALETRQPASGSIEFLTPDDRDVDWLQISPDGRKLAMVCNHDGYGRLQVRDLDTGEEQPPPGLEPGVALEPTWSPDSRLLAFSFTTPRDNSNIWVWDLEAGACRQITQVAAGGIPRDTFVGPELIRFRSFDGLEVPAFLYLPKSERPPVVVSVHGGPEGQSQPIFNPVTQYFVNRGYAVLVPNVRGSTGYGRAYTHLDDVEKRMDSVADLEAAAHWIRQSGRVDGDRMAVMGGSYGGFMVLAALTSYPELWAAGVDIVGVANFETFLRNTSAYRRHWRIPEYGDPERDLELLRRISPINHMDRIAAPLIVIHGDNDPRVPLSEAEQVVEAARSRGLPVEFLRFPDEGHGIVKLANKLVAYGAIAEFLDSHL
ncbi:MAG: S9 family peptidase [Chloroflexota bacterium]|nr:S9 family peptidase [Chloroflexota bacterium]